MAAFKECDSDEEWFWVKYSVVDKKSGQKRRMRWTEIWKRVQQDHKDRDLADHAAMLDAFPGSPGVVFNVQEIRQDTGD